MTRAAKMLEKWLEWSGGVENERTSQLAFLDWCFEVGWISEDQLVTAQDFIRWSADWLGGELRKYAAQFG